MPVVGFHKTQLSTSSLTPLCLPPYLPPYLPTFLLTNHLPALRSEHPRQALAHALVHLLLQKAGEPPGVEGGDGKKR
jgi:hypothetical protein